jgi:hypothetical protein
VGGGSLPNGLCWFTLGVAGGILCEIWCIPVCLPNVSQAGLDPESGGAADLLYSQCNVAWRNFPWARGSSVKVLILLAAFYVSSVAPVSQPGFGVTEFMLSASVH